MTNVRWFTWDGRNDLEHDSFADAERYARAMICGRQIEIYNIGPKGTTPRDGDIVAYIRKDALDRVWTDIQDCTVA